jgi:hypothetical protein
LAAELRKGIATVCDLMSREADKIKRNIALEHEVAAKKREL